MEAPNFPQPRGFHDPKFVDSELSQEPTEAEQVEQGA